MSKSMSRQLSERLPSPDRFLSPGRQLRPTSPNGFGNGLYSSVALDQGLEGLIGASPSTIREARLRLEKMASEVDGDVSPGPGDRFRCGSSCLVLAMRMVAVDGSKALRRLFDQGGRPVMQMSCCQWVEH